MSPLKTRNFGCRILEFSLNGLRTVVMENETLRVGILADKGTDIYEFLYKPIDIDCMWRSRIGIRGWQPWNSSVPSKMGPFLDFYFGGWQELFPNTDENCEVNGAELSLHGEACMLPWDYEVLCNEPEEIQVMFSVDTIRTPFRLEKILVMKTGQSMLEVSAKVTNIGNEAMDFMWGLHPALGKPFLTKDCVITLPKSKVRTDEILGSKFSRIAFDQKTDWPIVKDKNGTPIDLHFIPGEDAKCNDRVALYGFKYGWYAVTNPKLGLTFAMTWDKHIFPYILYWQSFSGWEGYPFYGTAYTLSLEPRTSFPFPLTRVIENNTQLSLAAGEALQTSYKALFTPTSGKIRSVSASGEIIEDNDENSKS